MKKFVKVTAVIGVICLFLGAGVLAAGMMMGGSFIGSREYRKRFGRVDGSDTISADGERIEKIFDTENINSLTVDGYMAAVSMESGTENQIMVSYPEELMDMEVYREKGELHVEYHPKAGYRDWDKDVSVVITVPEGFHFMEAELNAYAGRIEADEIFAEKLEVSCDVGDVLIHDGNVKYLDAECQAGAIEYQGICLEQAEADCDVGSISLALTEGGVDYGFEIENQMGSIEINGENIPVGRHVKKGGGSFFMDLDCNVGTIEVTFYDDSEIGEEI